MLYDFELAGRRVRLWQRQGETYGHVLMKALGYAMFVGEYPRLEIELRVGLRYKPDLVAVNEFGDASAPASRARFAFWGECGMVSMRKVAWLLKHGQIERLALFKIDCAVPAFVRELRESVEARYRERGRLLLVNFAPDIAERAARRRVERVPESCGTRRRRSKSPEPFGGLQRRRGLSAANDDIEVRECTTIEEFDACVRLQREAFGLPDLELSPRRHLIVARSAGGWTLGAFAGGRLVGFVLNQVAVRGAEVIGYSHMMAVAHEYQNRGLGARLKWAQRSRALSEGRRFIRWTWDPMQSRNAHFNLNRLGVLVRSYAVNYYGTDYSTATGEFGKPLGIDSDRLVAEWSLDSPRVEALARGAQPETPTEPEARVEIPTDWSSLLRQDPARARRELLRVREEFRSALASGLACYGFERDGARPLYLFSREP